MQNFIAGRKYRKESILEDGEPPVIIHLTGGVCGIIKTEEAKDLCLCGKNPKTLKQDEKFFKESKRGKRHMARNQEPANGLYIDNLMKATCVENERADICNYRTPTISTSDDDGCYHSKEMNTEKSSRNNSEKTGFPYSNRYGQKKKSDGFRKIQAVKNIDAWEESGTDTLENDRCIRKTCESKSFGRESSARRKNTTTLLNHTPILSSEHKVRGHAGRKKVFHICQQPGTDISSSTAGHETKNNVLHNFTGSKYIMSYCDDSEEQFGSGHKLYKKERNSKAYGKAESASAGKISTGSKLRVSVHQQVDIPANKYRTEERVESRSSSRTGSVYSPSRKRTTANPIDIPSCSLRIKVPSISDIFQKKIASIHYKSRIYIDSSTKDTRPGNFQDFRMSDGPETRKRKSLRDFENRREAELLDSKYTHYKPNKSCENKRASSVERTVTKHPVEKNSHKTKQQCYTNTMSVLITPDAGKKPQFLSTMSVTAGKVSRDEIFAKSDLGAGLKDAYNDGRNRNSYLAEAYFVQDLEQILRLLTNTTVGCMEWDGAKHSSVTQQFLPENKLETQGESKNGSRLLHKYRTSITCDITTGKIHGKSDIQMKRHAVPQQEVVEQTSSVSTSSIDYADELTDGKEATRASSTSERKKFSELDESVTKASRKQAFHRLQHYVKKEPSQEQSAQSGLILEKVSESPVMKTGYKRVSLKVKLHPQSEDKGVSRKIDEDDSVVSSREVSHEMTEEFERSGGKSFHDSSLLNKITHSGRLKQKRSEEILKRCQLPQKLGFVTSTMLGSVPFDTLSDILLTVLSFSKQFAISFSKVKPHRGKCISSPSVLLSGGSVSVTKRQVLKGRLRIHSAYWRHNLMEMLLSKTETPYSDYLGHESYVQVSPETVESSDVCEADRNTGSLTQRFRFYVKQFLPQAREANIVTGGQIAEEKSQKAYLRYVNNSNKLTQSGILHFEDLGSKVTNTDVTESNETFSNLHYIGQGSRDKTFTEDNLNGLVRVHSSATFGENADVKLRTSTARSSSVLAGHSGLQLSLSKQGKHERTDRGERIYHPESDIYDRTSSDEILPSYNGKLSEAIVTHLPGMYEKDEGKVEPSEKENNDQTDVREVFSTVKRLLDEIAKNTEERSQVPNNLSRELSRHISENESFSGLRKYIERQDENKDEPHVFVRPHRRYTWHDNTSEKIDGISQPIKYISDFYYRRRSDDSGVYSFTDSTMDSYGHKDSEWTLDNQMDHLYQTTSKNDRGKAKDALGPSRRGVLREIDKESASEEEAQWDEFDKAQSSRNAFKEKNVPQRRKDKFKDTSVWMKNQLGGLKSKGFEYLDPEKFSTLKKR